MYTFAGYCVIVSGIFYLDPLADTEDISSAMMLE